MKKALAWILLLVGMFLIGAGAPVMEFGMVWELLIPGCACLVLAFVVAVATMKYD